MAKVTKGDRVRINFTGTLEDGTIFDSTLESDCSTDECETDDCGCGCESGPLELVIGEGEIYSQIEDALIGMAPGELKKVLISAEEAFGEYDEEKVFTVPRSELPEDLTPEVGDELVLSGDDDEEIGVAVVEVSEESITFDANHPLAGEDLTFEIELLEIL
jgi:peptidylprolyl isomerase